MPTNSHIGRRSRSQRFQRLRASHPTRRSLSFSSADGTAAFGALFRTAGQVAILAEVLLPGTSVGLSELARRTWLPRTSAYREVKRLAEAGLLTVETVGREWQITSNPDSPVTAPVRQILAVSFGPVPTTD